MVLPDVQSSADRRNIPIRRVGVKGIRTPILVKSQSGAQHTVADVEMYVSLPADKKGTHMSRFWTLLSGINKPFAPQMMVEVMQEMLASLKSDGGYIRLAFPFFMEKSAPVSHLQSTMDYDVVLTAECADGKITVTQEVIAPVTSLCPCSKEISRYGAHNQRSHITIDALCSEALPFEELIRYSEKNGSCELWSLLKREDEKFVTEYAYDHAKFVEDIIRDVATDLNKDARIVSYELQVENFESIHNHSAYALITHDRRTSAV